MTAYTDLTAQVEATVENTFTTTVMSNFVKQAEKRCFDVADIPAFRKTSPTAMTSASRFYTYPIDFRAPVSFAVISASGVYTYLLPKQQDFILEAYPNPATTGTPAHYGIYDGTTFILGPTPDANYSVLLTYAYYPTSLVDAPTGTWLSNNFPNVLLKATIVEAGIFLKLEEDTMKVYYKELDDELALFKNLASGRLQSDTYRSGEPHMKAM